MKYIRIFLAFTCIAASLSASELKTELLTDPVQVGTVNQLALIHNGRALPEFESLPKVKGLRWVSSSKMESSRMINGQVSRTMIRIYDFKVEKPGKYTIPSAKVKAGRQTFHSGEVTFEALPMRLVSSRPDADGRGKEADTEIGKLVFTKINIFPDRREFYVGEEIPLEVQVYMLSNLDCRIDWPEIMTGDKSTVIFRDYKAKNPDNPKFDTPRRARTRIDGRIFDVYIFQTAIRPISAGKLSLSAADKVLITLRSSRPSRSIFDVDDDFIESFFGGGGRRIEHIAQASIEPIRIKPLPPQTEKSDFLGLIGEWNIRFTLPEKKYKVGEAVTLTVSITGTGSADSLNAPSLEIPGFRVYSPEVEKKSSSAVIKYVLIPTEAGNHEIKLSFSTFDPLTGKYKSSEFQKMLTTEKAAHLFKTAEKNSVVDAASADEDLSIPQQGKKAPSGVLYLKKPPFRDEFQLPLWKNSIFAALAAVFAGLIFWIFCEIRVLREKFRSADPGFQRRNNAKKAKNALLRKIRNCMPEKLSELDADIASYVNDALNFPPGASLSESSESLKEKDPELAETLGSFSLCSWSHSGFTPEFKKKLLAQLSRLVCIALLFLTIPADAAPKTKKIDSPESAMTAYDEGHFAEAEQYYRSMMKKSEPSARLCYNIGNCLYQQGKYAHALAQYEKALRLAPRDSDILENLNLTRRKLSLPEKNTLNSPSDVPPYLRDMFRPDEWILVTGIGLMLIFIGLGLRRVLGRKGITLSVMISGAVIVVLSMTAMISQYASSYDDAEAIVLTRSAAMHALPSDQSAKLNDIALQPGETVHIEETRLDWVRIRTGAAEGWVHRKDIQPILAD